MIRWMLNKWVSMLLALGLGAALVPATSTDSHADPPSQVDAEVKKTDDRSSSDVSKDDFFDTRCHVVYVRGP